MSTHQKGAAMLRVVFRKGHMDARAAENARASKRERLADGNGNSRCSPFRRRAFFFVAFMLVAMRECARASCLPKTDVYQKAGATQAGPDEVWAPQNFLCSRG